MKEVAEILEKIPSNVERIRRELAKKIYGQEKLIELLLAGILSRGHCLLTGDKCQISDDSVDDLCVFLCIAGTYVDNDLIKARHLHRAPIRKFVHKSGSNFF